jgi:hypothetical protein
MGKGEQRLEPWATIALPQPTHRIGEHSGPMEQGQVPCGGWGEKGVAMAPSNTQVMTRTWDPH